MPVEGASTSITCAEVVWPASEFSNDCLMSGGFGFSITSRTGFSPITRAVTRSASLAIPDCKLCLNLVDQMAARVTHDCGGIERSSPAVRHSDANVCRKLYISSLRTPARTTSFDQRSRRMLLGFIGLPPADPHCDSAVCSNSNPRHPLDCPVYRSSNASMSICQSTMAAVCLAMGELAACAQEIAK